MANCTKKNIEKVPIINEKSVNPLLRVLLSMQNKLLLLLLSDIWFLAPILYLTTYESAATAFDLVHKRIILVISNPVSSLG